VGVFSRDMSNAVFRFPSLNSDTHVLSGLRGSVSVYFVNSVENRHCTAVTSMLILHIL
jgi:hypothetical protein